MTRPRSQQILDLQTRFSRLQYTPTPGSTSDTVALATVYASAVTGVTGGVEESVWAYTESSVTPPYLILAGDAITVTVDAGSPVNVTFAATDTTPSRVAAKINTAVGGTVAFASGNRLRIHGAVLGSSGKVVLADFVAGTLAKLGLVAGTYNGIDAPQRGLVTWSLDGLGGTALLKTPDGQDILTDASGSILIGEGFIPPVRMLETPGGVPVHARTRVSGANLLLEYYARMPIRPEVETFNSNLALLDGTDTITFTVTDPDYGSPTVIVATFPAGPGLTRDQVVTRINDLWADALTLTLSGAAHVTGTISQPYTFNGVSSSIDISVDGGLPTNVDLSAAVTAADAAALINGAVAGVTASTVTTASGGEVLRIRSNNVDGTTSSIEIRPPAGGLTDVFQVLGLVPGRYRGYFLCQPSGTSEIKFFGLGRGSQADITVSSGNPTTLARMGLPAGTYSGLDEGEQDVRFPVLSASGTSGPVLALLPEVMDFGEVPIPAEPTVAKFLNRSTGSNQIQAMKLYSIDQLRLEGQGLDSAGRPAALGPDGLLPLVVTSQVRAEYENFFKKFIRGDFALRTVDALVTNVIEGGGDLGNTTPSSNAFTVDVDPTDASAGLVRYFYVRFGRVSTPFYVHYVDPIIDGTRWFVEASDTGGELAAFSNSAGAVRLYDANTEAAGTATTGKKVIPVTSSTAAQGDSTLRIFEKLAGNLQPVSLFRQVNAKWVTTVGDGVNSFGDFNGANAIQQALTFWNTWVGAADSTLRIHVKRGSYTVTAANGLIDVPSDMHLILEGEGDTATVISVTDGTSPAMRATSNCTLELRDLRLVGSGFNFLVDIQATSKMFARDVLSDRASYRFDDGYEGRFERCNCSIGAGSLPIFSILLGNGLTKDGFTFTECRLTGANNLPILSIGANSLGFFTGTGKVLFQDCKMLLGSTTLDVNSNLVGNCGVVDIVPNGWTSFSGAEGGHVDHLEYRNCEVTANTTAGTVSVLIHLIPIANGGATTASPFTTINESLRIDRLVISGGKWIAPRSNTLVNPFTVGLAWTDPGTYPENDVNSGRVEIRDVIIGFDESGSGGIDQGAPTQDLGSFFTTTEFGGARPATAIWGAVAVAANYLSMRNVNLVGMSQLSGSGDLFLKCDRAMDVDGIVLDDYKLSGPSAAPTNRVRIRTGNYSAGDLRGNFSVRNVFMRGSDAAAGSWGTNLFSIEPNNGGFDGNATSLEISGIRLMNFTILGSPSATVGFRFVDALFGSLYTGSAGSYDRVFVSKLQIRDCLTGIQGLFTSSVIATWSIVDSEISHCTNGMFFSTTFEIGELTFCRNKVHANTTSGVYLQVGDWVTTDEFAPACIVANDNVIRNNPNASGVQMQVFASAVAGNHQPRGSVLGNCFSSNSSVDGDFKINRVVGGVSSAFANPADPGATRNLRGIQTGHSLADPNTLFYQNNFGMYNNQGNLVTP